MRRKPSKNFRDDQNSHKNTPDLIGNIRSLRWVPLYCISSTKLIWRYFHKHLCSGTIFQYIFLLFDVFIVNTGDLREDNLFFVASACQLFTIESVTPFRREPKKPALLQPMFSTHVQVVSLDQFVLQSKMQCTLWYLCRSIQNSSLEEKSLRGCCRHRQRLDNWFFYLLGGTKKKKKISDLAQPVLLFATRGQAHV